MELAEFLRKPLVDKIYHIYKHGMIITDIIFNEYKVTLVKVHGSLFEMFVNPASLMITAINPLDRSSIRMQRYMRLVPDTAMA